MKLTKLQLEILTKALYTKVENKIQEMYNKPSLYNKIANKVKKEMHYIEALYFAKKVRDIQDTISELQAKINALNDEKRELNIKYSKEVLKNVAYHSLNCIPTLFTLEKNLEAKVKWEIAKDLPTKEQLESDILFLTLEGDTKDLLEKLTKKHKL